jgi:uncharacterized membrane protein (Fun14 family)
VQDVCLQRFLAEINWLEHYIIENLIFRATLLMGFSLKFELQDFNILR